VNVGAPAENHILLAKGRYLRQSQASLNSRQQESMIPPPPPRSPVGRSQKRFDFGSRQEPNQSAFMTLTGNGKHPLDKPGVLRAFQGRVPKEGTDYGYAKVPGSHGIGAIAFKAVEERPDERRVQVLQCDV